MKRIISALFLSILSIGFVSAQGDTESTKSKEQYKDGVYFASEDSFSAKTGWRYNVTLEVKGGKITSAKWDGANIKAGEDKITLSKAGKYGMAEKTGADAWYKQAAATEAYLLKTQDPSNIEYKDDKGHTDAISGATIHVVEFFDLAQKALAAGPIGYGPYKDGAYSAEEAAFNHGYKYKVSVTIISGYIAAVNWDGIAEDGGKSKAEKSEAGEYGMVANGGAMAPWFEQAKAIEANVIDSQSVDQPDAISGASISLDPFYTLLNKALSQAK